MHQSRKSSLLHGNAAAHFSVIAWQFLARKSVVVINQPLYYSPDLTCADFGLFPKPKVALKGQRFDDVETVRKHVTAICEIQFQKRTTRAPFGRLHERSEICIKRKGMYWIDNYVIADFIITA